MMTARVTDLFFMPARQLAGQVPPDYTASGLGIRIVKNEDGAGYWLFLLNKKQYAQRQNPLRYGTLAGKMFVMHADTAEAIMKDLAEADDPQLLLLEARTAMLTEVAHVHIEA